MGEEDLCESLHLREVYLLQLVTREFKVIHVWIVEFYRCQLIVCQTEADEVGHGRSIKRRQLVAIHRDHSHLVGIAREVDILNHVVVENEFHKIVRIRKFNLRNASIGKVDKHEVLHICQVYILHFDTISTEHIEWGCWFVCIHGALASGIGLYLIYGKIIIHGIAFHGHAAPLPVYASLGKVDK